ncbi:MAG TPA: hypothetical protein VK698_38680 [Kofleriaceae bacterium]|nr:hypothetical protein [Kofleriaceae bacterium]
MSKPAPDRIAEWRAAWPVALEAWSKFTRLRPPLLCLTVAEARDAGLTGSFAMIRLQDQAIVVSMPEVEACRVGHLPVEILAHEIGHHILAPATLTDHARLIARMRRALPTVEDRAPLVSNLYTDLLINDRLFRSADLRMDQVYRALAARPGRAGSRLFRVYLRIYEILWGLSRGELGGRVAGDEEEGDASLGARLVRSYAREWLRGGGRFAALLFPYLLEDVDAIARFAALHDTRAAGTGGQPTGLSEVDPDEIDGAVHPAEDDPDGDDGPRPPARAPVDVDGNRPAAGQAREPFEYGEILRAAGLVLTDHEVAVRYYAERARSHLVRFPSVAAPEHPEPLPEGLEPWSIGDPLDEIAWFETVALSPHVVPGMTTVRRVIGTTEGRARRRTPIDLDLYVDSSGSMTNPQHQLSFPALAGAIIALSALRAGARVQACLWSGAREHLHTDGFVRDETAVLRVLTGYFGGGTAFPIHRLRDTYAGRERRPRPAHVLVVSDDGVTTMFDQDERGQSGWDVCGRALAAAGGGGTLVLNLPVTWETLERKPYRDLMRARDEQGWQVHAVSTWDQLVGFAKAFSRRRYGPGIAAG